MDFAVISSSSSDNCVLVSEMDFITPPTNFIGREMK